MRNIKVLVCDDEPFILESVSYVVRKLGFDVETAVDGEQALGRARLLMPDLMVLDVRMPHLNGDEVCRILKADEQTRGIYIIIMTAFDQKHDYEAAMSAGANEYITKPFSPRALGERLRQKFGSTKAET